MTPKTDSELRAECERMIEQHKAVPGQTRVEICLTPERLLELVEKSIWQQQWIEKICSIIQPARNAEERGTDIAEILKARLQKLVALGERWRALAGQAQCVADEANAEDTPRLVLEMRTKARALRQCADELDLELTR